MKKIKLKLIVTICLLVLIISCNNRLIRNEYDRLIFEYRSVKGDWIWVENATSTNNTIKRL